MDWPIGEVARLSGTTSRTLRHYHAIGLLQPSRVTDGGQRHYDTAALLKLQEILILRQLGLGLEQIRSIQESRSSTAEVLTRHLHSLEDQRERLGIIIGTVRKTVGALEEGRQLMAEDILDGFDHRQYEEEVVDRWGKDAWDRSNRQWESLGEEGRRQHQETHRRLVRELAAAGAAGLKPDGPEVQELVRQHHEWVTLFADYTPEAYAGMGEMYVSDPRFRATYDSEGEGTAALLAAGMKVFAGRI